MMIAHGTVKCLMSGSTGELAVQLAQALHGLPRAMLAMPSRAGAGCAKGYSTRLGAVGRSEEVVRGCLLCRCSP